MLIRAAGLPLFFLEELSAVWPEEFPENERIRADFDALLLRLGESPFRTAVYNARKVFFQKQKTPPEAFHRLLRHHEHIPEATALLHRLERLNDLNSGRTRKYQEVLLENYRALQGFAQHETLQRALLFSSHELLGRLPGFRERRPELFDKKDRRTAFSLLKYLSRAVVKPIPLSKFATVALTRMNAGLPENAPSWIKSEVTPNVALLPALYDVLLQEPAFYRSLFVSLNPCITATRRASWIYFNGEEESFQHLENHAIADLVVQILLSRQRKMPAEALLDLLGEEVNASREQLQALLSDLVGIGLLEWDLPEKGLSPGWCGGLYQYLGFLPQAPALVVETAALLQWLRSAGRSFSYMSVQEVQAAQQQASSRLGDFFHHFGGEMPQIPAEQIFFEDVNEDVRMEMPDGVLQQLIGDLKNCWQAKPTFGATGLHARVITFGQGMLTDGESIDFITFCEKFLQESSHQTRQVELPRDGGKAGALLQVFKKETGEYGAVVNGIFPGGGKLFARWLHLFPADFRQQLAAWNESMVFPWQGWSNANFQPVHSNTTLSVPDGRIAARSGGRNMILGNLMVRREKNLLQLIDSESNEIVRLTDLGLEAAALRPPVMQVLQCLGIPYFSLHPLVREHTTWEIGGIGWRFRDRLEFRSLVLLRKTWEIQPGLAHSWPGKPGEPGFFYLIRKKLSEMNVPALFFARFYGEKPQYFDLNSPVFMYLFGKMLRQTEYPVLLTEMLPMPGQCVVRKEGLHAAEFVVEFEV